MAMCHMIVFHETQAKTYFHSTSKIQVPKMAMATPKPLQKKECDRREVSVETDSGLQQLQIS